MRRQGGSLIILLFGRNNNKNNIQRGGDRKITEEFIIYSQLTGEMEGICLGVLPLLSLDILMNVINYEDEGCDTFNLDILSG